MEGESINITSVVLNHLGVSYELILAISLSDLKSSTWNKKKIGVF